uniref:SON DNA binding protein n=1 Tax=Salarias fasciatus TaxID=181472 RepID=A0A672F7B1_SALFA
MQTWPRSSLCPQDHSTGRRSAEPTHHVESVKTASPSEPPEPVGLIELLEPVGPVEPVGLVEPVGPVESVGLVEPVGPVESVGLVEPVEPVAHVLNIVLRRAMEHMESGFLWRRRLRRAPKRVLLQDQSLQQRTQPRRTSSQSLSSRSGLSAPCSLCVWFSPSHPVSLRLTPQAVDISQAVTERIRAQRRLAENPYDVTAICMLSRAQEQVDAWAQSNTVPGLFTGSTGAQVLSSEELSSGGPQAWLKKDQFLRAAPVSGGVGEFLMRKMGWRTGEGLGRNREGTVEPIVIDFKVDRKGLVAEGEKPQKQTGGLVVTKDLMGKHPVSALIELCNKRRIMQPDFVMVHHSGPDHRKNFLFKVSPSGRTSVLRPGHLQDTRWTLWSGSSWTLWS